MKKLLLLGVLLAGAAQAQVTSWENSPLNFNNSPLNFDNSSLNFNNSPLNFNNSPLNYGATNGVYDNRGARQGYVVPNQDGTVNYFDNNGVRRGYTPNPYGR